MSKFNPQDHMITMGRDKQYLEVKWRLVWFREDHPLESGWSIETEMIAPLPNVVMKAVIKNEHGNVVSTGHASTPDVAKPVWTSREIEKAETAAIGRALAHASYGTQFTNEDEGDNLADAPVASTRKPEPLATTARDTIDQAAYMAHAAKQGLSPIEALDALDVDDLNDYAGTRQEARDALDAYLAAYPEPEEEPSAKTKKLRKPHSAKMLLRSLQQVDGANGETLPISLSQVKVLSVGLSQYAMNTGQVYELVFRYMLKQAGIKPDEAGRYSRTKLTEPQTDWFVEWLRGDANTIQTEIMNLRQHIDALELGSQ